MDRVYLNGDWVARDAARVSAFDRGFVFGDGVYEVIPAYGGRLFRLPQHLARLQNSLDAIRIANPLDTNGWGEICGELIAQNGSRDQYVYLQVTRGVAPRDHAFPTGIAPSVFAYAQPIQYPSAAQLRDGVSAITVPDLRWARCDIKAIALLANVLARQQAIEQGAAEAILVRGEAVTEGAASNIFIVHGGVLLTAPKGPAILPGVTRDLILELAHAAAVPFREETHITTAMLLGADEVWMTSSTKEILPITRVDACPIGTGRPGALHATLHAAYQRYKEAFRAGRAE